MLHHTKEVKVSRRRHAKEGQEEQAQQTKKLVRYLRPNKGGLGEDIIRKTAEACR